MHIEFNCSQCQQRLRVPQEVSGSQSRCPQCGTVQQVPSQSAHAASYFADSTSPPPPPPPPTTALPAPALPTTVSPHQQEPSPDSVSGNPYREDPKTQQNPYMAPAAYGHYNVANRFQLAGLDKRFLGALIDWGCSIGVMVPGGLLAGLGESINDDTLQGFGGALLILGLLVLAIIQWWLIATRGQSIGKILVKTRIVLLSGVPPGFLHGVLLRSWVIPCSMCCWPFGIVVLIVDKLFILGDSRQCIHDLIASTVVVPVEEAPAPDTYGLNPNGNAR